MNKYFYILIQAKYYNSNEMYADVIKVTSNANLWNSLNNIGDLIGANIMPSKKAAYEAAERLNKEFKTRAAA